MRLALLVALVLPALAADPAPAEPPAPPPPEQATVIRVYDGDTVTIATGDPVRLRWVNTPELRPLEAFAEEARDAAASFVAGKQVLLSYAEPNRDGYGRLVADVVVDGISLEEQLLRRGLAHVMLLPPIEDGLDYLFEAQDEAKHAGLGIWSTDRYRGVLHITSFHANGRGNDRADPNVEYLRVCNITDQPQDLGGYRITNIRKQSWTFPAFTLPAGHTVKVHTGRGRDQTDPRQQIAIHLGSDVPIWNNGRDLATIWDPQGEKVDERLHEVKSEGE